MARVYLDCGPAEDLYSAWKPPTAILVDGPHGVSGFPGDLPTVAGLADWYAPHAAKGTRFGGFAKADNWTNWDPHGERRNRSVDGQTAIVTASFNGGTERS